jgi:hypothetical protein
MVGRTWVIAPDTDSLRERWKALIAETDLTTKANLFHPHLHDGKPGDKHIDKGVKEQLSGSSSQRTFSVTQDKASVIEPVRFGFRSFDRQWIIPDARLINRPNPRLWKIFSAKQIYLTAPHDRSPTGGPALSVTAYVPDVHHYHGRGGRVFPLWADAAATVPNTPGGLLTELSTIYGCPVTGPDLFAYIAAIAASPAYTELFRDHLKQPGLRIPICASRQLFEKAVELGREVIWLHTFGERFTEGRPAGPPRVDTDEPTVPLGGSLPSDMAAMPHELEYDPILRWLKIGTGYIANISARVWSYEVSGWNVVRQWWSYRRMNRSKPPMGDRRPPSKLSEIQPTTWRPEYTTELLALLRVLTRLIALEPCQSDLLAQIVKGPTIDSDTLRAVGSLGEASAAPHEVQDDGANGVAN